MSALESRLAGRDPSPPKDVEPSELVRRLMDTKRPSEVVPFPRNDDDGVPIAEVRLIVLTQYEIDCCCANAEVYTRKMLKELHKLTDEQTNSVRREAWEEIYNNAKCVEVLYEACREAGDVSKRAFVAPDSLRKLMTTDEAASLFRSYEVVQYKFGPLWRVLSDAEIEQWIEKLTAGVGAYPLAGLAPGALVQLVISMAFRLRSLKIDTGSSGSPSSDGQNESSENDVAKD